MRRQECLHDLRISLSASAPGIVASNSLAEKSPSAHLAATSFLWRAESLLPFPSLQLSTIVDVVADDEMGWENFRPMTQRPRSAIEAVFLSPRLSMCSPFDKQQ